MLVRGNLLNQDWLDFADVDFVTILLAYVWLGFGQTGAGLFALGQGLLMDLFSGGMMGLFAMLYLAVFFAIQLGSRFFDLQSFRGMMILVLLAVLLRQVMLLGMLHLFSFTIQFSLPNYVSFALSSIISGLLAPPIFLLLDLVDRFLERLLSKQE